MLLGELVFAERWCSIFSDADRYALVSMPKSYMRQGSEALTRA